MTNIHHPQKKEIDESIISKVDDNVKNHDTNFKMKNQRAVVTQFQEQTTGTNLANGSHLQL